MDTLAFPTVVRVVYKGFIKNRLDDVAERVMDVSVTVRRCTDQSLFGIINEEIVVCAVVVGLIVQLPLNSEQLMFEVQVEYRLRLLEALVFLSFSSGQKQIFTLINLRSLDIRTRYLSFSRFRLADRSNGRLFRV